MKSLMPRHSHLMTAPPTTSIPLFTATTRPAISYPLKLATLLIFVACSASPAAERITWETALADMRPFTGPSIKGVDTTTLNGKIVTGYQGWFNTPNDGFGLGWKHYQHPNGKFQPGSVSVDYWPHTAEFDQSKLEETSFRKQDGSKAMVYSSVQADVVDTHFRWMKEYGIEAAFLQRFAEPSTGSPRHFRHNNRVLERVRSSANAHGRAYVVMYDLSGMKKGTLHLIKEDWRRLVDGMGITKDERDQAYLSHRGKPLLAIWGAGFKGRPYTLTEIMDLVNFFKKDPVYGGTTLMLGVPTGWRELHRDCINDPALHELLLACDVVSPWSVGRYGTLEQVVQHDKHFWQQDRIWCAERGLDYLPVVFPGFSWANLKENAPLDSIPRLGGRFLWQQYVSLIEGGQTMIYQAMFDEIDEGTAICKVDNDPPGGPSPFLSYAPQPEDHYLWLVGMAQRMLRTPATLTHEVPIRQAESP